MHSDERPALGPELYNKDYYLKSLPGIEYLEHDTIDPAILETIRFSGVKAGQHILDFGCGRGNLVLELAKRGSNAVGVDFSKDAVEFAQSYAKHFSEAVQQRVQFFQLTMHELQFERKFDVVVCNQVYEHLHDWELNILIEKFKRALKPSGVLMISTPNLNYIRYLYPLKRTLEFPFKLMKQLLRLVRGKRKHAASFGTFMKEIFKIKYPESEHTKLHINLQTPDSIRKFIEATGFLVQVNCIDYHKNLISRITQSWLGETIWVTARIRMN